MNNKSQFQDCWETQNDKETRANQKDKNNEREKPTDEENVFSNEPGDNENDDLEGDDEDEVDHDIDHDIVDLQRLGLPVHVLRINGFELVPHKGYVRQTIEDKLQSLSDILKIDYTGEAKNPTYELLFENTYEWSEVERIGSMYWPMYMGVTGIVNTEMLSKWNLCEDTNDPRTCMLIFPNEPDMLGKVIANTALHEIGHVFGIQNEKSYEGSDREGHNGDPTNCMFDIPLHKNYHKHGSKNIRTKIYTIKDGETIAAIARKNGFRQEAFLLSFRGKDGRSNKEILKGKGREIWVRDIQEEIKFRREVEFADKSFNKNQIAFIRGMIKKGKGALEVRSRR